MSEAVAISDHEKRLYDEAKEKLELAVMQALKQDVDAALRLTWAATRILEEIRDVDNARVSKQKRLERVASEVRAWPRWLRNAVGR